MRIDLKTQVKEFMLETIEDDEGWSWYDLASKAISEYELYHAHDNDDHWVWDMAIELVGARATINDMDKPTNYTVVAFKHLGYWEFYKSNLNNIDMFMDAIRHNLNSDEYEISFHQIIVNESGLEKLERLFDIASRF